MTAPSFPEKGLPATNRPIGSGWERLPMEPANWHLIFLDYCRLGPTRNLRKLYLLHWAKQNRNLRAKEPPNAPGSWRDKAKEWDWERRAGLFDEDMEAEVAVAFQQRRAEQIRIELAHVERLNAAIEEMAGKTGMATQQVTKRAPDGEGSVTVTVHGGQSAQLLQHIETSRKVARQALAMDNPDLSIEVGPRKAAPTENMAWLKEVLNPVPPGTPAAKPADEPTPPTT